MGYQILIADDEAEIRDLLRLYLEKDGYTVIEAEDGAEALEQMKNHEISLAVLDVMMPGIDGFRVLQQIRKEWNIPVIILSARVSDNDKILGLDLGADDYLAKPFNPLEAVARIKSNIRRFYALGAVDGAGETKRELTVGELRLDLDSCILYRNQEAIELTSIEFRLLQLFMENPGRVFTKQQLFEHGWGQEFIVADNNIMVCISKLRAKLSEDAGQYIKTIRGLGYRMEKDRGEIH